MDGKDFLNLVLNSFNLDFLRSSNSICHIFVVERILIQDWRFRVWWCAGFWFDFTLLPWKSPLPVPKRSVSLAFSSKFNGRKSNIKCTLLRLVVEEHYLGVECVMKRHLWIIKNLWKIPYIFEIEREPRISIIIPNKDHNDDLDKYLKSVYEKTWLRTLNYNSAEITVWRKHLLIWNVGKYA